MELGRLCYIILFWRFLVGYGLVGILSLLFCIYLFIKILDIKKFPKEFKPIG